MYQLDFLNSNKWQYYYESEDIKEIDKEVFNLTNKGVFTRILLDNNLLCWINGTDYQYWFWKNKYVLKRGLDFDYVKSYHNHQKKEGESVCKRKSLK